MSNKKVTKKLRKLEKEIKDLEKEIKNSKFTKLKNKTIRNLKITARATQLVAPYVLCAGILVGGFNTIGLGIPFKEGDLISRYANIMKEYDTLGNIRCEEQYQYYENQANIVKHYSKWKKLDDDFYTREVKTYNVKKISEEEILELIDKDYNKIYDKTLDLISVVTEKKNNLSEEEINKDDFFRFVIYDKDEDKIIIREETKEENFYYTLLYILLSLVAGAIADVIRRFGFNYNFSKHIDKIKSEYNKEDIDSLQKKIEIKRNNYNRLTR